MNNVAITNKILFIYWNERSNLTQHLNQHLNQFKKTVARISGKTTNKSFPGLWFTAVLHLSVSQDSQKTERSAPGKDFIISQWSSITICGALPRKTTSCVLFTTNSNISINKQNNYLFYIEQKLESVQNQHTLYFNAFIIWELDEIGEFDQEFFVRLSIKWVEASWIVLT